MASGPWLDGGDADSSTVKKPPRGFYVTRWSLPSGFIDIVFDLMNGFLTDEMAGGTQQMSCQI
jgi:hypothetical protein